MQKVIYKTLIVPGLGFALLYQATSVVTVTYFRKRLATAYSIGRSGMGLTFALAPFTQLLLDQYAWQGNWLLIHYYEICNEISVYIFN